MTSTRNQFLFTLLELTPSPRGGMVVASEGDGFRQIFSQLREAGIEPAAARNEHGMFTMTFTKHKLHTVDSPSEVSRAILDLLERHSAMSAKEIIRELHLTPLAVASGLRELVRAGEVAQAHPAAEDGTKRYRLRGR